MEKGLQLDGDDHDFFDPEDAYAFYNRAYAPEYEDNHYALNYEENQGSLPNGGDHEFFNPEDAYAFYNRANAPDHEENHYAREHEENKIQPPSVQPVPATQDDRRCTSNGDYMDWHLLRACSKGDVDLFKYLTRHNHADAKLSTPHGNNCLHVAAMFGRSKLAKEIWSKTPCLLLSINCDGETPLIAALMSANRCLASDMIAAAIAEYSKEEMVLKEMLLATDRRGENALHHAIRNDFDDLALQLLDRVPKLSVEIEKSVQSGTLPQPSIKKSERTACRESAMHMAARKGFPKVVEKLLEIEYAADSCGGEESALQVAVRTGNKDIVKKLLKGRPNLARKENFLGYTPLVRAILHNKIELVEIFLKHDPSLAYYKSKSSGNTPFIEAAIVGSVEIAKMIMEACPDSIYIPNKEGNSALHVAIEEKQLHFVDFVLKEKYLYRRLINQTSNNGSLPLHLAATSTDPKILRSLLDVEGQDCSAVDVFASNAANKVYGERSTLPTLRWIESFALLQSKVSSGWTNLSQVNEKWEKEKGAKKNLKELSEKYSTRTSTVATLITTITFAAAFTLPGGLSNDPPDNGLPVLAKKAAFQFFLFFNSIAMCSSLAAAYLCILSTWEDLEILLNYTTMTKYLMWCAFQSTSLAFGLALFVVISPSNFWLSFLILMVCVILPFSTYYIGRWPIKKLYYRLGYKPKELMPLLEN